MKNELKPAAPSGSRTANCCASLISRKVGLIQELFRLISKIVTSRWKLDIYVMAKKITIGAR